MKEYAGKILMLVENNYPDDPRVKNEAETLTSSGYKVTVLALKGDGEKNREVINNVVVYRIPTITLFNKTHKYDANFLQIAWSNVKSIIGYICEYFYFTTISSLVSLYILIKEGFDVVHAHNPPDTLFIVGGFYKLFGKKFVFDHHDLSPELYLSRFKKNGGIIHKLLMVAEKINLKLADVVIATNESYKLVEIERCKIDPGKIFIVRNGPREDRIMTGSRDIELEKMGKYILVYVGEMGPQDGVDYLLRALYHLVFNIGRKDIFCLIIGKGDSMAVLKDLSEKLNLNEYVKFTGYVSDEDLVRYLSTADICLDPNPSNPLNDVSTWIKVMEYMAMGKPIISFDLKETRYSAQEAAVFVPPNDIVEFANAIKYLLENPDIRIQKGKYGKIRVNEELMWPIVSKNLLNAYSKLFN